MTQCGMCNTALPLHRAVLKRSCQSGTRAGRSRNMARAGGACPQLRRHHYAKYNCAHFEFPGKCLCALLSACCRTRSDSATLLLCRRGSFAGGVLAPRTAVGGLQGWAGIRCTLVSTCPGAAPCASHLFGIIGGLTLARCSPPARRRLAKRAQIPSGSGRTRTGRMWSCPCRSAARTGGRRGLGGVATGRLKSLSYG